MTNKTMNIGGGGGTSFQFLNNGDSVTGRIMDMEEKQQTDPKSGAPKFFDGGNPMMMFVITLATDLRNSVGLREPQEGDDGTRSVFLKGSTKPASQSSLAAVLGAVKAATGGNDLTVGGTLTLQRIGLGPASVGMSAPNLYAAAYAPPVVSLEPAAAVAAPVAQAVQQAAPTLAPGAIPAQYVPPQAAPVAAAPVAAATPAAGQMDVVIAGLRAAGHDDAAINAMFPGAIPVAAAVAVADPLAAYANDPRVIAMRGAGMTDVQIMQVPGLVPVA